MTDECEELNCVDRISAGSLVLYISAVTLVHLGTAAVFTTLKTPPRKKEKKKRKEGKIHPVGLQFTFMELLCKSSVVVYFI